MTSTLRNILAEKLLSLALTISTGESQKRLAVHLLKYFQEEMDVAGVDHLRR